MTQSAGSDQEGEEMPGLTPEKESSSSSSLVVV